MKPTKQTVYLPVNGDAPLAVCHDYTDYYDSITGVLEKKGYFFTPEELNEYTANVIKQALENAEKAASKSADITEQVAVEFGNFLFSKGIEYYDDLTNGVNYTMENKEGIFTMKELFQEFLKTKQ